MQRLERDPIAGHAQVAALDQQQPQIAGEIGVAERSRCGAGPASAGRWWDRRGRRAARARACSCWKNGASRSALAGAEDVAGDVGVHHAVGERIADAGRRLGVRVDDAPAPVRAAGHVGGEELDEAAGGLQVMAGPQDRKGR